MGIISLNNTKSLVSQTASSAVFTSSFRINERVWDTAFIIVVFFILVPWFKRATCTCKDTQISVHVVMATKVESFMLLNSSYMFAISSLTGVPKSQPCCTTYMENNRDSMLYRDHLINTKPQLKQVHVYQKWMKIISKKSSIVPN